MQEPQYIEIDKNRNKFYYKDIEMKVLHRTDGPACEYANGSKYWYVDGNCHRLDGPAVEYADGPKYWYVNNKSLTEKEFDKLTKETVLSMDEIAAKFGIDVSRLKIVK